MDSFNIYEPVTVPEVVKRAFVLAVKSLASVELRRWAVRDEVLVGLLFLVAETTVLGR